MRAVHTSGAGTASNGHGARRSTRSVVLPRSASNTPARPAVGITMRSASTRPRPQGSTRPDHRGGNTVERPAGAPRPRRAACRFGSDVQQRDHAGVAPDLDHAARELDCGARVGRAIQGHEHVGKRKAAVRGRDDAALRIVRHEQRHRLRPSRHRLGDRAVQPASEAFTPFRCDDEQVDRRAFEIALSATAGKRLDSACSRRARRAPQTRPFRAARLQQVPAPSVAAHAGTRSIRGARPRRHPAARSSSGAAAHRERVRECALARRGEVRRVDDEFDSREAQFFRDTFFTFVVLPEAAAAGAAPGGDDDGFGARRVALLVREPICARRTSIARTLGGRRATCCCREAG